MGQEAFQALGLGRRHLRKHPGQFVGCKACRDRMVIRGHYTLSDQDL